MIEKIKDIEPVVGFGILIATNIFAVAGWVTQWWRNRKAITVRAYLGSDPNWLRSPHGVAAHFATGIAPVILTVTGTNNGAAGITIICGYAKYADKVSMLLQHDSHKDVVLPIHGQRDKWHATMEYEQVANLTDLYLMDTNHRQWRMSKKEFTKFKIYAKGQYEKARENKRDDIR